MTGGGPEATDYSLGQRSAAASARALVTPALAPPCYLFAPHGRPIRGFSQRQSSTSVSIHSVRTFIFGLGGLERKARAPSLEGAIRMADHSKSYVACSTRGGISAGSCSSTGRNCGPAISSLGATGAIWARISSCSSSWLVLFYLRARTSCSLSRWTPGPQARANLCGRLTALSGRRADPSSFLGDQASRQGALSSRRLHESRAGRGSAAGSWSEYLVSKQGLAMR